MIIFFLVWKNLQILLFIVNFVWASSKRQHQVEGRIKRFKVLPTPLAGRWRWAQQTRYSLFFKTWQKPFFIASCSKALVMYVVLIAPRSLVVGSVGVVCGSKSSLSATVQRAANELLLFKSRENERECVKIRVCVAPSPLPKMTEPSGLMFCVLSR